MPKTSETKLRKCERCGIDVEVDKIDLPARCTDPACPLNEESRREKAARPAQSTLSTILNAG